MPFRPLLLCVACFCVSIAGIGSSGALSAEAWLEDSFSDFADGRLDASGQNIYVAADGTVRTIHRFDLNEDGYIDLLFNNSHDYFYHIPATLGTVDTEGRVSHEFLPVEGSLHAAVDDLNGDALLDVVFCPNKDEIHPRRLLTIIYGSPEGWTRRRTGGFLTAFGADRVATADVNGDGRTDIAVLNATAWAPGQPEGRIVRVYLGAEGGFMQSRRIEVGVPKAVDMAAGKIDSDDAADLVVLGEDGRIHLLLSSRFDDKSRTIRSDILTLPCEKASCITPADVSGDGRMDLVVGTDDGVLILHGKGDGTFGEPVRIPNVKATQISAGDLDGDGKADLVLTYATSATAVGGQLLGAGALSANYLHVLWGGEDGFSDGNSKKIPIRHPKCTALGDMNGDGRCDIVVAIRHGEETFAANSLVLLGREGRTFERAKGELPTQGPEHVVFAPTEGKLPARAVFANRVGGSLGEIVTPMIFWGGPKGFSEKRQKTLDIYNPVDLDTADLDGDGHLDLIVSTLEGRVLHLDRMGTMILWGSDNGFSTDNVQRVPSFMALGYCVADLDGDGHLDLVAPSYTGGNTRQTNPSYIYWGGKDGFAPKRRTLLFCQSCAGALAADFDRDGKLDLAMVTHRDGASHRSRSQVFYNDGKRFQSPQVTELPTNGPHWFWHTDLGHVYNRQYRQWYESSAYELEALHAGGTLHAEAEVPEGARLEFSIRAAKNRDGLPSAEWKAVRDGRFTLKPVDRFIQYRAEFLSDNGDRYPSLDQVRVVFE